MAKYTFGEIAINQMNNRRKLEEEQKQFNEKMAEEIRQANLINFADKQRNTIMEQHYANENIYKQGMLANDTAITNYKLNEPITKGDFSGSIEQWEKAQETGSTKGLLNTNPNAPKADKWITSYEPDPDKPGWKKKMMTNSTTGEIRWTGGWEQETAQTGSGNTQKRISDNYGKLDATINKVRMLTSNRMNDAGWVTKIVGGNKIISGINPNTGERVNYTEDEYLKNIVEPAWNEAADAARQLAEDSGYGEAYDSIQNYVDANKGNVTKALKEFYEDNPEYKDNRGLKQSAIWYSGKYKGVNFAK